MKMKKTILATLLVWAVLALAASALVTGTTDIAPTTSPTPTDQKGQCGEVTGIRVIQTPTATTTATPDAAVRHDQGKESIRVPMLVGDKITPYEGGN